MTRSDADRPIAVGDLVQVVRGHKCALGKIFTVRKFGASTAFGYKCIVCKEGWETVAELPDVEVSRGAWIELYRLKRIPPLSELAGERTEETTRVTA